MEHDWDLHAVVRGCNATATANFSSSASMAALTSQTFSSDSPGGRFFSGQDPFDGGNNGEELRELYNPFFSTSPVTEQPRPVSSQTTTFSQFSSPATEKVQIHRGSATTPRIKRRKNQTKNVCHVPAESLSSDIWAWRKYGQKPIKGSPYPRGYYRCSSSKGCLARKQVERNRSDPGMFIVTYTAEHNHPAPTHRNSLAGSTRQKSATATTLTLPDFSPLSSSESEDGGPARSPMAEKKDLVGDGECEFGSSGMVLNDDFFVGFEEIESLATGDCFYDNFPANLDL